MFLDFAVEFILAKWGRLNIGAALARKLGEQMDEMAPHKPRRGKVSGEQRKFADMLVTRCYNMTGAKGKVRTALARSNAHY